MSKRYVVSKKNLPTFLPINFTAIVYLLLDKFSAPEWLWGAMGILLLLIWVGAIYNISTAEESVDIMKGKSDAHS